MLEAQEIQKIIECLKKLQPEATEAELQKMGENLYQLGLFIVRLKIKEVNDFKQPNSNSP
ncbi:MAG TPA: hypothetical protein VJH06_00910 [Candidatus Paceibacterota bacterium]